MAGLPAAARGSRRRRPGSRTARAANRSDVACWSPGWVGAGETVGTRRGWAQGGCEGARGDPAALTGAAVGGRLTRDAPSLLQAAQGGARDLLRPFLLQRLREEVHAHGACGELDAHLVNLRIPDGVLPQAREGERARHVLVIEELALLVDHQRESRATGGLVPLADGVALVIGRLHARLEVEPRDRAHLLQGNE